MEEKEKKRELLKGSHLILLMSKKRGSGYSVCLGLYTALKQYKLPKSTKAVNCYKDKIGRNQKRNKKEKIKTGSRNSVAGGEQWQEIANSQHCEILQVTKFS